MSITWFLKVADQYDNRIYYIILFKSTTYLDNLTCFSHSQLYEGCIATQYYNKELHFCPFFLCAPETSVRYSSNKFKRK